VVDIQTHFGYDAMQNRIQKTYISVTDTTRTYYIRDAQGNVMAVYQRRKDTVIWQEQHLYGSSRLGTWEPNQRLTPSVDTTKKWQIREGQKRYELTNHLGNVLVTVSDRRQGAAPVSQQFTYYEAVVITATDYYPFGLEMPGRTFQSGNYRYGFNGKENDRNGSWSGNQHVQDYGFRLYVPALGKFLSVDPIGAEYPWNSSYAYAENSPIRFIDLDGLEKALTKFEQNIGTTSIKIIQNVKFGLNRIRNANGLYDKRYWTADGDSKLVLVTGQKPSDAINSIVNNTSKNQTLDCAQFVQVVQFGAMIETYKEDAFNKRIGEKMTLYSFQSTGLKRDKTYERSETNESFAINGSPTSITSLDEAQILKLAPVGSRVTVSNFVIDRLASSKDEKSKEFAKQIRLRGWANENMIKVGEDSYAAFGISTAAKPFVSLNDVKKALVAEYYKGRKYTKQEETELLKSIGVSQVEIFKQ
jgi:RHS repeat-associated protein